MQHWTVCTYSCGLESAWQRIVCPLLSGTSGLTCLRPVHGLLPQLRGDGIVSSAGGAAIGLSEGTECWWWSAFQRNYNFWSSKGTKTQITGWGFLIIKQSTVMQPSINATYTYYTSDVSNSVLGKDLLGRGPHSEGFSGWSWNTSKHSSASPAQTQNSHSTEQPG